MERFIDVRALRVLFAGGGTGGHLFPAIAIAEEVRKLEPDTELLFVGTSGKIEATVVPQRGFRFESIWISGFRRGFRISNIVLPIKIIVSMFQARSILKEYRPDVIVGTGGYVCGPIVRSAVAMKIPTLLQEQNSYPGVTTRLLARMVDEVHITFEQSREYLKGAKQIFLSGNPTRDALEGASRDEALVFFGFKKTAQAKTVFLFGGSLGAHSMNEAMMKHLGTIQNKGIRLIWQTGTEDLANAMKAASTYSKEQLWISAFIDRMDFAYAACDLVVSRAGATTISELTRLGKPAILIPYPRAAADHQTINARALEERGAAVIVRDADANEQLPAAISALLDDRLLQEMSKNSKALGKPDAAKSIARHVLTLGRKNTYIRT